MHISIDTNCTEKISLIEMSIKIGMLQLQFNKMYRGRELRCPRIADVMPCNRYQELLRYLHFVNYDSINAQDKLAKIRPLISMV